jgi:hypothetical protein
MKQDQKMLNREVARLRGDKPLPPVSADILGLGVGLASDRDDLAGMVDGLSQTAPLENPKTPAIEDDQKPKQSLDLGDLIA